MSDHPTPPGGQDPFEHLPPELRRMLEQLGGEQVLRQLQGALAGHGGGPVNWQLAGQVALQLAAEGDRGPSEEERARAREGLQLAEHWLDDSPLPAPPDAGRLVVASRQEWVNAALGAIRPLVEPVAAAATQAMAQLTEQQLDDVDLDEVGRQLGVPELSGMLAGTDLSGMLRGVGATLTGLHAGQIVGQLARQLLGQYDLGVPTAPRAEAFTLAVNVDEAFGGWDLDATEVGIVLALTEAAHRRLFHAVPWLEAHLHGLVAQFAAGTRIDPDQLEDVARELMLGVDPEDPEALQEAMSRAGEFRLQPTPEQGRVLERIQGVLCLVQGWARHEVARAGEGRLPSLDRVDEILRRRRATKGDGEELLEQLLGLDLTPDDPTVGDAFVAAVEEARGPEGLRRALAHPENLPDADELAEPSRWLVRMASGEAVPDDASALFEGLDEAPVERSAEERRRHPDEDDGGSQE